MRERETDMSDYEELKRYLLGRLPEGLEDRLELRLLLETELFELAEAVEAELLDDCARGELTEMDCQQLTRRLATSAGGQRRLAQARSIAALPSLTSSASGSRVLQFFRPSRSASPWARAALAAGLAGLIVAAWQVERAREPRPETRQAVLRGEPAAPAPSPRSPAATTAASAASAPAEVPSARPVPSKPLSKHPHAPLLTASLELAMTTLRGAEGDLPEVRLSPQVRRVELRLDLEEGEGYVSYEASVAREDGGEVWSQRDLAPPKAGSPVELTLAARGLREGIYVVTLKGRNREGTTEDVGFPRFRVVRP
jgi:hypothetical protein